jgi:hypothetical protein
MGIEALTGKPIKFRNIVPTITGTEIDEGLRSGRIALVTAPAGYENLLDVARPLPPVGNTTGSNSYITHEVNLDGLGFVARRKTSIVMACSRQGHKRSPGADTMISCRRRATCTSPPSIAW